MDKEGVTQPNGTGQKHNWNQLFPLNYFVLLTASPFLHLRPGHVRKINSVANKAYVRPNFFKAAMS